MNQDFLYQRIQQLGTQLFGIPDIFDQLDPFLRILSGFLDGIQTSLKNEIDVEKVDDDTEIYLDIDYEKLYYNMRDAKAKWLFNLSSWKNVLDENQTAQIAREYREANIAHSNKVGRNDPCPCGSGKKYKNCCGKKVN